MKIIGLIPFWSGKSNSKDLKKLAGKYLIEYSVELLNSSELIDEVIIYSSDDQILNYIDDELGIKYVKRPTRLDNNEILIEHIVEAFINDYEADIIVLTNPSCPFIKRTTVDSCIENIKNGNHDSAFTALEIQKFVWFKNLPLNFDNSQYSPKINSLEKIIIEQGLTYILSKEAFLKNRSRIGNNPLIKIINHYEGHEINDDEDFKIAELIVNSGMFQRY